MAQCYDVFLSHNSADKEAEALLKLCVTAFLNDIKKIVEKTGNVAKLCHCSK